MVQIITFLQLKIKSYILLIAVIPRLWNIAKLDYCYECPEKMNGQIKSILFCLISVLCVILTGRHRSWSGCFQRKLSLSLEPAVQSPDETALHQPGSSPYCASACKSGCNCFVQVTFNLKECNVTAQVSDELRMSIFLTWNPLSFSVHPEAECPALSVYTACVIPLESALVSAALKTCTHKKMNRYMFHSSLRLSFHIFH